jgi:hypothetical protein
MARRIVGIFLAVSAAFVLVWVATYPSPDPKSIEYVYWKAGLCRMNLDTATGTMVGDAGRDKLVVGKTKEQIEKRFGHLLAPDEASPYLRSCYLNSDWKDRSVLFISQNPWMIVFNNGKATNLALIKGC